MDSDPFLIEPVSVRTRRFTAEIRPVLFRDWAAFMVALKKLAPFLSQGDYAGAVVAEEAALRDMIRIGAGVAPEMLDDLHPDDIVALAGGVLAVNSDFFARSVMAAIVTATEALARTVEKPPVDPAEGPTSLPISDPGDTASTPAAT